MSLKAGCEQHIKTETTTVNQKSNVLNLADAEAELKSCVEKIGRDILPQNRAGQNNPNTRQDPTPTHLILGTPGLGKTHAIREIIQRLPHNHVVWVFQPTLVKCFEFADEIADVASSVKIWRGRSAKTDPDSDEFMCKKHEIVTEVARRGFSVKSSMCEKKRKNQTQLCEHFATCSYIKQQKDFRNAKTGVFIMTHACLGRPPQTPPPDLVIIDEDPTFSLLESIDMSIKDLTKAGWVDILSEEFDEEMDEPSGITEFDTDGNPAEDLREVIAAFLAALESPAPLSEVQKFLAAYDVKQVLKQLLKFHKKQSAILSPAMSKSDLYEHFEFSELRQVDDFLKVFKASIHEASTLQARKRTGDMRLDFNSITRAFDHTGRLSGIAAHILQKPLLDPKIPVIILDGTADPVLLARALGRKLSVHKIEVKRQGTVIRCVGRSFSNNSLLPSTPGVEHAAETADRETLWAGLRSIIDREITKSETGVLICTTLPVKAEAQKRLADVIQQTEKLTFTHFAANRGVNSWSEFDTVIIVGRKQPPAQPVCDIARAFFATDEKPILPMTNFEPRKRKIFDKRGGSHIITQPVALDMRVQRVLWQLREAEVIQSLDRVRAARFPRRIILLNALDLRPAGEDPDDAQQGIPGDYCRHFTQLVADENRAEAILKSTGGLLPLAPRPLHRIAPHVFKTEAAAKKWLQRTNIDAELSRYPVRRNVHVRLHNQRGQPWRLIALGANDNANQRAARESLERQLAVPVTTFET